MPLPDSIKSDMRTESEGCRTMNISQRVVSFYLDDRKSAAKQMPMRELRSDGTNRR